MEATNEKAKVSTKHIPEHLAFLILSKLPIKSVKRIGCCKKSWNNLFENPSFMSMYLNNFTSNYDDSSLLVHTLPQYVEAANWESTLYLLAGERFENGVKLDWPPPWLENSGYILVLGSGSINGTLFLMKLDTIALWNPAIKEFNVIPPSPGEFVPPSWYRGVKFQGFGYDCVTDDYKVIRCMSHVYPYVDRADLEHLLCQNVSPLPPLWEMFMNSLLCQSYTWEIYSLRSNNWRRLDDTPNCSFENGYSHVYLDGMCHWLGDIDYEQCLVSFDFSNEVFFTTPMPYDWDEITTYLGSVDDDLPFHYPVQRHLVALSGSIGLISYLSDTTIFHISILGEIGAEESWIKLYTFGPLHFAVYPMGVGQNGEIFFRKKDHGLIWFSLKTQTIDHLGFGGYLRYSKIGSYRESLLPIRGLNN